jgi:hypothetical protein
MTDTRLAQAKAAGWEVECESPLELWHSETGSRASGIAARMVLDAIAMGAITKAQEASSPDSYAAELERLITLCEKVVKVSSYPLSDKDKYARVFSQELSLSIYELFASLRLSFDYYDRS